MTDPFIQFGAPHDWYPKARRLKRHIICHLGPTNSGKTYEALNRLQTAERGIYCGPLRLLAWEVYEKMNTAGVACDLWTGQEIKEIEGSKHVSCTVEMVDVNRVYEVAVVDECQLLGDKERGWAWTRAILGLPAIELHLCGSPAFLQIVSELAQEMGDEVEVRRYDRLSPLKTQKKPVKSWAEIEPGDCVVAFSRKKLFQLKNEIEVATKHKGIKCCIVYGGLPPDARREQARLFNDETSGWNVLVASDAIGMGLNLSISRIIFSSMEKFDGVIDRPLTAAEVKQISGRAGRFGSQYETGTVAGRDKMDIQLIERALAKEDEIIESCGLKPSCEQLQLFAQVHGLKIRKTEEDYKEALEEKRRLQEEEDEEEQKHGHKRLSRLERRRRPIPSSFTEFRLVLQYFIEASSHLGSNSQDLYFLCDLREMLDVARLIEEIPLNLQDRYTFCIAPVDTKQTELMAYLRYFAQQFYRDKVVRMGVDILSEKIPSTPLELKHLEEVHAVIDVYLWLGIRFGEDIFVELQDAAAAAVTCSELIEKGLRKLKPKEAQQQQKRGGGGGRMGSMGQRQATRTRRGRR